MPTKNPPHPGHSIKDACLDPLNLRVSEAHEDFVMLGFFGCQHDS